MLLNLVCTLSTSNDTYKCQVTWYNLASPKPSVKIVTLCSGVILRQKMKEMNERMTHIIRILKAYYYSIDNRALTDSRELCSTYLQKGSENLFHCYAALLFLALSIQNLTCFASFHYGLIQNLRLQK